MRITRRTDYAIHLIADLALSPEGCLGLRKLADEHGVTYAFARTVQQGLLKSGIIEAWRGINGGIRLAKDLDKITLLDVFEAAQNPLDTAFSTYDFSWCECNGRGCITKKLWNNAEQSMRKVLSSTTIHDLLKPQLQAS